MKTFYFNMIQDELFSKEITITVTDEDSQQNHIIGSFTVCHMHVLIHIIPCNDW